MNRFAMLRGRSGNGPSTTVTTRRRAKWLAVIAAITLPVAIVSAPFAVAGTTPPFTIGPLNAAVVPGSDASQTLDDPEGNVKELGPLNSNTTKIGVIHNDAVPTLGLTNPNGQVDLRQAFLGTKKDGDGDDWIYFAWERDNNSGSGFISFEFMKSKPPVACGDYSGNQDVLIATCNPWANRQAGDFLILWDQQGGSKDLFLRTWSGTKPNLTLSAPQLLNANVSAADYSADGFFGEGALNLTDAIFGGAHSCVSFANVIPSTVTGNSDSADYKDTVLQPIVPIGNCTSTTVTTPKDGAGANIPAGGASITTAGVIPVKDSAVVDIQGGTATPAGSVAFFLCKVNSPALCNTGGTSVGSTNLTGASYPVTVVSPTAYVTSAGRYCWRGEFTGDSANNITGSSDSTVGECFVVNPVTPTLTTTAGADVTLGTAITDTASLTGTAPKPTLNVIETTAPNPATRTPATGTIAFTLFGPATGSCGSLVATRTATVSGDNTYGPVSATPTTAGNYHWKASYNGDSPNTNGQTHNANCTETGEDVTVGPASTTTVTTPQVASAPIPNPVPVGTSVTDHAVVTGTAAGGSPTGTVNFFVCNPTQVAGNGGTCSTGGTAAGSNKALTAGANNTSTADSDIVVANVVGVWCFRAVYTPNTVNYTGSSDASTGECFTVKDSTSASSVQTWLPNDSATITSTGGSALKGTLSFTLFDSADCTGTVLRTAETFAIDASSPVTRTTTNNSVSVSTSKTVSWKVDFTSDNQLVDGSTHCEKTQLVITN